MAQDLAKVLIELLEPLASSNGLELVTVEVTGGRKSPIVRVLLDTEDGIDIDAIHTASHWVEETLDEADPISGTYTLEVSSPGIDRPLRKQSDFVRFAGETVTVKAKPEPGTRTAWTGVLSGVEGDDVVLDVEGEIVHVPFVSIVKARIKGVISFDQKGA